MSTSTNQQISEVIRRRLMPHRHTAMLCAVTVAFAVRALIGDSDLATILFFLTVVVLLIFFLYAIQSDELVGEERALRSERRRHSAIGWTLAVAAICVSFCDNLLAPTPLKLIGQLIWMWFFGFVAWIELRKVLRQREITGEAISMVISVYLLFGITWSFLYDVIYQIQPMAFSLNGAASTLVAPGHPVFPVLAISASSLSPPSVTGISHP